MVAVQPVSVFYFAMDCGDCRKTHCQKAVVRQHPLLALSGCRPKAVFRLPAQSKPCSCPCLEQASAFRTLQTLVTADAGYQNDANVKHLQEHNIPALIADNQMRSRDERFEKQEACELLTLLYRSV